MTRRLLTLVVAASVSLVIAGAAWPASGVVVDTKGRPVPRARVYAFLGETINSRKTLIHADSKGKFSFKPPGPGRYYYLADAKGCGFAMACDRMVSPGKITLKLWPERQLSGQVVDPSGKPVAGATVGIHAFDAWDSSADAAKGGKPWIWFRDQPAFAGSVKTDKLGKFVIGRLPDLATFKTVRLRLDVTAPGRAPSYKFFTKRDVASKLTMVSSRACTLAGIVYLPDKSGVAPKTLGVIAYHSLSGAAPAYSSIYLDENGRFEFKDLPQGPITINIGGKILGYDESTDQPILDPSTEWILLAMPKLALVPGEARNVEIVLSKGATVKGKVIDKATGKPVTGGYLQVVRAGQPANQTRQVRIESDGQFTVNATPGAFSISVYYCLVDGRYVSARNSEDPNAKAPSREFTLASGEETTDVVFEIDAGAVSEPYVYLGPVQPLPSDFALKAGTYQLTWDPNSPRVEDFYIRSTIEGDQAKAKMVRLPELKSKKPLYACVRLDSESDLLCFIFDDSTGTGKAYNTLYVDANRNGDLTDDQPVTWRSTGPSGYTPWVEVQAHQGTGDAQTSNPVKIRWRMVSGSPMNMLRKGAWTGTIDSTKGPAKVILSDSSGNGLYNDRVMTADSSADRSSGSTQGDRIAFRPGNGPFPSPYWQGITQGGPNILGSKGYVVSASPAGGEITVKPYTGPMGKLLVRKINIGGRPGKLISVGITGIGGDVQYEGMSGKAINLPAGSYTINYVSLSLGAGSKTLQIWGRLDRSVSIKANSQAVVDIVGKPRLTILASQRSVLIKSGKDSPIAWSYEFGDIKDASVYESGNIRAVAKVRFDSSRKSITVRPNPGGG